MQVTSVLLVIAVSGLWMFALIADGQPIDFYDEIIGSDEKQLLLRMAELIESIGADDSDVDSGRFVTSNVDNNSASVSNELKDMRPGERCILPMRRGVCRALIPRWTYDPASRDCKEFKFGGCDGNGNNFSSRKQCMDVCRGV